MNAKQRFAAVSRGERTDRIPFLPTIFEHSAKLIGKTPSQTARDVDLLAEAQIKAYELYRHDSVTVGIDVYNIEAEALGCEIKYHGDNSIPGVISHPFSQGVSPDDIAYSGDLGRIGILLKSAEKINYAIGSEVGVGIGVSGPFSIAAELIGYENMIIQCMDDDEAVHRMLGAILEFQKKYCLDIINKGLGVAIFESWAAPPLISPDVYREFAKPYETELIRFIKSNNLAAVPLIIGGDTTAIADDIIETGTTLLIADYKTDVSAFIEKASRSDLLVRGNIDPKVVQNGTKEEILLHVKRILDKVGDYRKFVLGTGVIPYDTPSENILLIRRYLEDRAV